MSTYLKPIDNLPIYNQNQFVWQNQPLTYRLADQRYYVLGTYTPQELQNPVESIELFKVNLSTYKTDFLVNNQVVAYFQYIEGVSTLGVDTIQADTISVNTLTSSSYKIEPRLTTPNGLDFKRIDGSIIMGINTLNSVMNSLYTNTGGTLSQIQDPKGSFRMNKYGFQFGGLNDATRHSSSASIYANTNTLDINGMTTGNDPNTRQVRIYAEGGLDFAGPLRIGSQNQGQFIRRMFGWTSSSRYGFSGASTTITITIPSEYGAMPNIDYNVSCNAVLATGPPVMVGGILNKTTTTFQVIFIKFGSGVTDFRPNFLITYFE